jgi:hypothetical protein
MADVELDVTEGAFTLKVPGFGDTVEAFAVPVHFASAVAKFNRKTHTLVVTIPLLP